jgi:hypothetical protein
MNTSSSRSGKNSLTFESVVCSQLELQRRAASFSHRRSTMCRRSTQYPLSGSLKSSDRLSGSSNRLMLLPPVSSQLSVSCPSSRASTSRPSDVTAQFLKTRNSNCSKRSRTSSTNSFSGTRMGSVIERQSFVSMFYWDAPSRSGAIKKV